MGSNKDTSIKKRRIYPRAHTICLLKLSCCAYDAVALIAAQFLLWRYLCNFCMYIVLCSVFLLIFMRFWLICATPTSPPQTKWTKKTTTYSGLRQFTFPSKKRKKSRTRQKYSSIWLQEQHVLTKRRQTYRTQRIDRCVSRVTIAKPTKRNNIL